MLRLNLGRSQSSMYALGLLLLAIVLLGVAIGGDRAGGLRFTDYPKTKPSVCFDCENKVGGSANYLAGRSKCFTCENQISGSDGASNAGAAQSSKCYTCGENPLIWRDQLLQHKRPIL